MPGHHSNDLTSFDGAQQSEEGKETVQACRHADLDNLSHAEITVETRPSTSRLHLTALLSGPQSGTADEQPTMSSQGIGRVSTNS